MVKLLHWAPLLFLFVLFGHMAHSAPAVPAAIPGAYEILDSSKVQFSVSNFGLFTVHGHFAQFSGKIEIKEPFSDSLVHAEIRTRSVDTENEKRDHHLQSADFFKVDQFADMSFVSTHLSGTPQNFELQGQLTITGISLPAVLHCQLTDQMTDSTGQTIKFTAKTKINRKSYQLNYGSTIGDMVTIELEIQAFKAAASTEPI